MRLPFRVFADADSPIALSEFNGAAATFAAWSASNSAAVLGSTGEAAT